MTAETTEGPSPRRPRTPLRIAALLVLALAGSLAALAHIAAAVAQEAGGDAGAQVAEFALAPEDRVLYRDALEAIEKKNWSRARTLAGRGHNGLAARIVEWFFFRERGAGTFAEVAGFIDQNPDWPWRGTLRRNAERLLGDGARYDDGEVRAWMERWPPLIGEGRAVLGEILLRADEEDEGLALLRGAWSGTVLSRKQELHIWRRYRRSLREEDHLRRTDMLLWERQIRAARRMVPRLPRRHRALAEARIGLMEFGGNVDTLILRVPEDQAGDGGLAFERVRWRRSKGFDERAREILLAPPLDPVRPDLWWRERKIQVRRALGEGAITDAYRIAAQHGLRSIAPGYADAEWLAGWVVLRFLEEPITALGHFARMHAAVKYPVSLARAAYWAGRAAAAAGDAALAKTWYERAALHQLTYYGQLAMHERGESVRLDRPPPLVPALAEAETFRDKELVRATRLLAELGFARLASPFVLKLGEDAETPGERALTAVLAHDIGRTDLGVRVAKGAALEGITMIVRGYPLVDLAAGEGVEPALLLAIARQETLFNPDAISPAGARGILQIMPATARIVARSIGVPYSRRRLTEDPDYNSLLASAYLVALLERYDGSYVLAIAAYNAGEGRVNRWIRTYGDPRTPDVDAIDWIELMPFEETRNYVQRVLENLQVYRLRLADEEPAYLRLAQDLARGG